MKKEDSFDVEILPDGTIRSETNPISPANHSGCEAFFRLLNDLTGTVAKRTKRTHKGLTTTQHHHDHDTEKA